jgi:lycopene cyclase domain-containing protein
MSYTFTAIAFVAASIFFDLKITKVSLLRRRAFWTSYAIIVPFQLLTNWWLTSRNIVMYRSGAIIGVRIAAAPLEDLLYGFALILGVLSLWVRLGKRS